MFRSCASSRRLILVLASGLVLASPLARAQSGDAGGPGRTYPSLPGAVDKPPAWLKAGGPFDVAKFLATPPDARNAAPLYLDALLEFSNEVASCFPDDEATRARAKTAQDRSKRAAAAEEALAKGQTARADASIAEYAAGFRKLAEAQKRPQCAFATGLGMATLLPHAQAARQVIRVYAMKTARDLARGKIEDAVANVGVCLRLSRDIRPRGPMISQLVSFSMDSVCVRQMIVPILGTRGLRIEQCDKLLKLLAEHEAASADPYIEGGEYEALSTLATLQEFVGPLDALREKYGAADGTSRGQLLFTLLGEADDPKAVSEIDARLRDWKPGDDAKVADFLQQSCKARLEGGARPYTDRLRVAKSPGDVAFPQDPGLGRLVRALYSPGEEFLVSAVRASAEVRAAQCLTALRRWRLTKNTPPKDMAEVVKAAKLAATPIDPFDGRPIRLATIGGEPVVYSVGKDLKDDGGRIDSDRDRKPGDLVFRIAPPAAR